MSNISSKDVHVPLYLRIDATRQILQLIRGEKVEKTYPISTSKFGLGFEPGSNQTPLGRFIVSEKIGGGCGPRRCLQEPLGYRGDRLARWR